MQSQLRAIGGSGCRLSGWAFLLGRREPAPGVQVWKSLPVPRSRVTSCYVANNQGCLSTIFASPIENSCGSCILMSNLTRTAGGLPDTCAGGLTGTPCAECPQGQLVKGYAR